ncbi:hypothetical protein ACOTC9_04410 [Achromobacter xylosoxidans]
MDQDQDGEISFTMVKFSMKASDAGLQKGIDAIRSAFAQAGIGIPIEARQIRTNGTKQVVMVSSSQPEVVEAEDAGEATDVEATEIVEERAPARRVSTTRAKPKVKNYTAIEDPGFGSTNPTLKEFAAQMGPSTDPKKLLVIAYWFKHHLKQPDVTNDAIYTAFRTIGWTVPNIAQIVRELRASRDQRLIKGSNPNSSEIGLLGENAVDEMGKTE